MWIALSELFKAAVGLFMFVLAVVVALFVALVTYTPMWIKQALCKHVDYWETSACDAVCRRCNKNLGFVADIRKKRSKS